MEKETAKVDETTPMVPIGDPGLIENILRYLKVQLRFLFKLFRTIVCFSWKRAEAS